MNLISKSKEEKGYTLIETIVAMALFLSVLIPLITVLGNSMLDRKAKLTDRALALAVSEMNSIAETKDFSETRKVTEDGLVVRRSVQGNAPLIEVDVIIQTAGEQGKLVLSLKRLFLVYR